MEEVGLNKVTVICFFKGLIVLFYFLLFYLS